MKPAAIFGNLCWLAASLPEYRRFKRDAQNLEAVQRRRLTHYLKQNAQSAFGLEHDFAGIGSWEEYSSRVPIHRYDEYAPWIKRIAAGEPRVLTTEDVRLFEPSSGSSGPAKWIPYTPSLQGEIRRAVAVWSANMFLSRPGLLGGRAYWSLTPQMTVPQPAESVIPVGFDEDSAYLGGITQRLINRTLVTHPALRQVRDMEMFWHLTLLLLLQSKDLRLISIWHPSFLELLIQRLRENWTALLEDLESGLTIANPALQVRRSPARARELAALGCDDLHRIWPRLQLISCWTDGHAADFIPALKVLFPQVSVQPKSLIATEAFVTVPIDGLRPLTLRSHVFEFLDENDRVRAPWQLEEGGIYTVIVTTGGGFYRYSLGDRVEVDGFFHDVPSLRFLGKEDQVSDYYGEKLTENFIATVMHKLLSPFEAAPRFALLAIDDSLSTPAYVLYVEIDEKLPNSFAQQLERELRANPHYDLCIRLGQLGAVRINKVGKNTFERYAKRLSDMGMRLGDIKPTWLSPYSGWHHHFHLIE